MRKIIVLLAACAAVSEFWIKGMAGVAFAGMMLYLFSLIGQAAEKEQQPE